MRVYQLMACGYFVINHARYTVYSEKVYHTQKQARVAMPEFFKFMTTAKKVGDTMVMAKEDLRILLHPLVLVNNKNKKTKENEK